MKIDILSDLHLDFYFKSKTNLREPAVKVKLAEIFGDKINSDMLIIAGDIGHYNKQNIELLKIIQQKYYKYIVCVLGNHDYYLVSGNQQKQYKNNSFNRVTEMRDLINAQKNMYCLDGDVVEIEGIRFCGCDGWYSSAYLKENFVFTSFSQKSINNQWRNSMNDAGFIKGIENYDDIYKIEIPKIEAIYQNCDVMITHVNPSFYQKNMSEKFGTCQSNTFYCFNGHNFMSNGTMKYWIFGHIHDEIEYEFDGVKCICNPLGYPSKINYVGLVNIKSIEI